MAGMQVESTQQSDGTAPESSAAAQRRLRSLQTYQTNCGPSSTAIIDSTTSQLTYLAPPHLPPGFVTTPVFNSRPALPVVTPSTFTPGRQISKSPDGQWITIFHPNPPPNEGGTLAIYPSSILSPSALAAPSNAFSTFAIPSTPLAIHHFPHARLFTQSGRSPPIGPKPSISRDSSAGPSLLILLPSCLLLCSPQAYFETGNLMINPNTSLGLGATASWRMGLLQCPLHTRWHAQVDVTAQQPPDIGIRAKRGWIGSVVGSEAIWVSYEVGDQVKVVRVEIRENLAKQTSMTVTPLPNVPRIAPPKSRHLDLQGVVFVQLESPVQEATQNDSDQPPVVLERVGAVLVLRESASSEFEPNPTQSEGLKTRLELFGFEQRRVELAEGFQEIDSASGDVTMTWDWFTIPKPLNSTISPVGHSIISLHPLPHVKPYTLALVLLDTPNGLQLSHVNLTATPPDTDTSEWNALFGESVKIRDDLDVNDLSLCISQGTERGELGLVGLTTTDFGTVLLVNSRLTELKNESTEIRNAQHAKDAALSILLAMKQGVDWSDAIRAAMGSVTKGEQEGLAEGIAKEFYAIAEDDVQIKVTEGLMKLETALFSFLNDRRLALASELAHLTEAMSLFTRCARSSKDGTISFDLDSIWPLIRLAEWVGSVLGRTSREAVLEQANLEWEETESTSFPEPSRLVYLLHPALRHVLIRLHSQLLVFVKFVQDLDKAIPPPSRVTYQMNGSSNRDPKSTVLARGIVRDVLDREGLDLRLWGRALEKIQRQYSDSTDDTPLITLSIGTSQSRSALKEIISTLPSPSSLFKAPYPTETEYDAITFEPLPPLNGITTNNQGKPKVKTVCVRCGWRSTAVGRLTLAKAQGQNRNFSQGVWTEWRKERETRCGCGGSWVMEFHQ